MALLVAGLAVALGGLVQGLAGFGLALLAVPIVALLDPSLVPGPMLIATTTHSMLSLAREHKHVDWRGVGWAMLGRLPGTVVGVILVGSLPQRPFSLLVGLVVLAGVLVSVVSWSPRPTPRALVVAGVVSGSFGTATSIGGPPVALLYQHSTGAQVRATLGAYFVLGSITSMTGLLIADQVQAHQVLAGVVLIPFVVAGFLLSSPLRKVIDAKGIRVPVLVLSAVSALLLIGRAALG